MLQSFAFERPFDDDSRRAVPNRTGLLVADQSLFIVRFKDKLAVIQPAAEEAGGSACRIEREKKPMLVERQV